MRRSSLITIILLVLIIIGLSVALVLTNLPQKTQEEMAGETTKVNDVNKTSKDNKAEIPTSVSLEDEKVEKMANMLTPTYFTFDCFTKEIGPYTQKDMSNTEKMTIAYYIEVEKKVQYSEDNGGYHYFYKADLDKGIKSVFGDENYTPENFNVMFREYQYDSNNQMFISYSKGGGGGPSNIRPITGIYKVEEYSDRYEAYSKYMVTYAEDPSFTDYATGEYLGKTWRVLGSTSIQGKTLGTYKDFQTGDDRYGKYIDDYVSGVTKKSIVFPEAGYSTFQHGDELMYKHFDEVSEYKTTFMKADDGTFYWLQTERIK